MRAIGGLEPGWGLTVLRIAMGLVFAVHGYAKFAAGLARPRRSSPRSRFRYPS